MKRLKLIGFDKKVKIQGNYGFLKGLLNNSLQGLVVSLMFIGLLVLLDFFARHIAASLFSSDACLFQRIGVSIYELNDSIGLKFLDYFKDVIVIVAGILGVILGLFFTTFLNIITTKYANINSVVIRQLQEQKTINRYFKLLSILVASSIIFQFLLLAGYSPTIISAFIFSASVIITILSFVAYGRFSLIYFNAGYLVLDIISENNSILYRAYRNSKLFNSSNSKFRLIQKIYANIGKVKLIVEESIKPSLSNTALDSISDELLSFSLHYSRFKHIIPSGSDWHITIQKHKKWDEASSFEFRQNDKTGNSLLPENVDDYNSIEKIIINTQFFIFKQESSVPERMQLIINQFKFLQVISFQCEQDIFTTFFIKLEEYILQEIKAEEKLEQRVQYVSLYSTLLVHYLVGFNHNLERVVKIDNLKKLAKNVYDFKSIDKVMNLPYSVRIWIDKYQEKLRNEKEIEGEIVTTIFFTEYELVHQFQYLMKSHFEKVSEFVFKQVIELANKLQSENFLVETLELSNEALELHQKIDFFSKILETKIKSLNELNLKKEEEFHFIERENILKKNDAFRIELTKNIWNLGVSSYKVNSEDLPDMFGSFYHFVSTDILNKILIENPEELENYLPKFCSFNLLYLEKLKKGIDEKRFEYSTSKLYPILVDLFEICSISILIFKAYGLKEAEKSFFDFWETLFNGDVQKEATFWSFMLPISEYYGQPFIRMSTPSYMKEHERKDRFEKFIKNSKLVRIEKVKGHIIDMPHYVTDIEDIYFKEVVRKLSVDGIGGLILNELSEVFIEYFLRTRIALKDLDIKETSHGENFRRYLGRN